MVDTLTLINNGTAAWEVTTFSGADIITQIGVINPDIELTIVGTRYEITNDGYPTHPLEFLDDQDNVLLSQSTTGSFESDSGVNWVDNDTSVEFTLTQGLSNQLTTYRCTVHSAAMVGNIISPEIDYTPNTGSVSITSPAEGAVVTSPFDVVMQATDFTIEAASNGPSDGAGHFHILVDQDAIAAGEAIPNDPDNGYYHYGDGSTTATLDLDPGAKTIRIQAGTANHLAYDLTDSVDIVVESDIQGTPIINAIDNVNQPSLETVFAAVAADPTARDNLSQSDRNIDEMSTSLGAVRGLDTNEEAVLKVLCRREGRNPANFADLDAVAADVSFVQDLSVRKVATDIIKQSFKAKNAISANDRATREMICHPAGLDATTFTDVADVLSDNSALTTITTNAQATRALVAAAMQEVAASQTVMQEVAASQTVMQELASSQTAMQEVASSQTAMQEVTASQTARDVIFSSLTARSVYLSSSHILGTLWSSEPAALDFWNSGWSPALPYNDGYMRGGVVTDSNVASELQPAVRPDRPDTIDGEAAFFQDAVGQGGAEEGLSFTFDLTYAQDLHITTFFYWIDYADTDSRMFVKVGGNRVFNLDNGAGNHHTFTDRTFDVSGFNGETEVEIGITSVNSFQHVGMFTNLRFS
jgi:hypothetical protein